MKHSSFCILIVLLLVWTAVAEPPELPVYAPRPLHILIPKWVPGLTGKDYIGDFAQYSVQGQNLLEANFRIPLTDGRLQSYYSRAKEATTTGFTNPYAAILALEAVRRFGTYSEYSALFTPQNLTSDDEKLKQMSFKNDSAERQKATDIRPVLATEIEGVTSLYFYQNVPGKAPVILGTAVIKKGDAYFPIWFPTTHPLDNDIVSAFAVQTLHHHLPFYVEQNDMQQRP